MRDDPLRLVGKTIAEKYLVESVVGEGGFALVYRATHLLWKRPVALKVFRALEHVSAADSKQLLEAFHQEGALLADLSERSAAIVQARDVGELQTDGGARFPYMVLEWLEGATLEDVLVQEAAAGTPQRTLAEAVRLLQPIADALDLAHARGVAHRDVKPANVFVVGDARGTDTTVKILDFGIAKVVSDAQRETGGFAKTAGKVSSFTPAYAAPEQFSRTYGATGPWTDVYALALVVVEVVTGRAPLEGDDLVQLAVAAADPARRPTPRTLGVDLGAAAEAVFARALAVKPEERYATAGEFWRALAGSDATSGSHAARVTGSATATAVAPAAAAAAATLLDPEAAARVAAPAPSARSSRRPLLLVVAAAVIAGVAAAFVVPKLLRRDGAAATGGASAAGIPAPAGSVSTADARCPAGMLPVPGGAYFMGADDGASAEKPAHAVRIMPYCIDRFEATVDDYKSCSDVGDCKRAWTTNEWRGITQKDRDAYDPLCNATDPARRAKHPINCVDWEMADRFCKKRGKRLPSEAEWEFAARGPDGRRYPWGDEAPSELRLNACGSECAEWGRAHQIDLPSMYAASDGWANTAPVGSFPKGASPYGVEDVVGNVWEWVADWYGGYTKDEITDPRGPGEGTERVIRGGAWNGAEPTWVRPTFRYKNKPDERSHGIGMRCAK
jgi:formylglycine-generating enzyme required for sulfatase activity